MQALKQELLGYLKKDLWPDLLFDIIGSILYAFGVYTFAVGADFAPGGVSGLAVIIHHFFQQIPIGTCILCINIPIILLCYRVMGKMFLIRSLKTMFISSFFLDAVFPRFPLYQGDTMIQATGAYTGASRQVLMCACSKNQISAIRKIAFRMDHHAIVTVGAYDEAFGEGFQDPHK